MKPFVLVFLALTPALGACGGGASEPGAPELGSGDHSPGSVTFTEIAASPGAPLQDPRDLAFNPLRPGELWIVNHDDDSVVIVHDAPEETRTAEYRKDGYALHFMAEPSALAFGADETTIGFPGTFATCGESRNTYDDMAPGNDFMGPVLWSSDLSVFAEHNPNGLGSHLDMLHCSPLCMGIAHEAGNAYWVFAGLSSSIYWYDFGVDDGIGNDDHSDGRARQLAAGEVAYVEGIPSHVVYDAASGLVYVADTGHGRIAALDPTTGAPGDALPELERMAEHVRIDGAVVTDVVPPGELGQPSGLELRDGLLYVTDAADGRILAFDLDGQLVNWLDTGLGAGALAGLAFGPDGKIYFVDRVGERVLRIDP